MRQVNDDWQCKKCPKSRPNRKSCFSIMVKPEIVHYCEKLTLQDAGGGLGVISHHSVGDAPANPKFLDFCNFDPYFHLVESFLTIFYYFHKEIIVENFCPPKKNRFFHKNGQKHIFLTGEYPHLVTIDPQHAGINTAISGGFSSVERRASRRQEAHESQ